MDTAQWPQDLGLVKPMEEMIMSSSSNMNPRPTNQLQVNNNMERRLVRPQKEQALNCPRCNSINTKFCYYNNYSLNQPRYFCKACKRYWTEGGSLRNVPVGGSSRKNKKPSSSSTSSLPTMIAPSSSKKIASEFHPNTSSTSQNPKFQEGQDLSLAFPPLPELTSNVSSAMGLNLNPFVPLMHPMVPIIPEYASEYYRSSTLSFPLDVGVGGRLLFPFGETRQANNSTSNTGDGVDQFEQDIKVSPPLGFWNGMIGGGGSSSSSW